MMPSVTPEDAVRLLNEMFAADPKAIQALVNYRVPCNELLEQHPSAQVGPYPEYCGPSKIGMLGVLNGVFGTRINGGGHIGIAVRLDRKTLLGFIFLGSE